MLFGGQGLVRGLPLAGVSNSLVLTYWWTLVPLFISVPLYFSLSLSFNLWKLKTCFAKLRILPVNTKVHWGLFCLSCFLFLIPSCSPPPSYSLDLWKLGTSFAISQYLESLSQSFFYAWATYCRIKNLSLLPLSFSLSLCLIWISDLFHSQNLSFLSFSPYPFLSLHWFTKIQDLLCDFTAKENEKIKERKRAQNVIVRGSNFANLRGACPFFLYI